ncbi:MAG: ActS/PrrB/RegB family redox-sensitive histidine kinase [Pseudomonadota bacterium]
MDAKSYARIMEDRALIRLDTLIRLRLYAIIGQLGAVLVVAFGLNYPMPWPACLFLIGLSAGLNLYLALRYRANHRLSGQGAFWLLLFDILQLTTLLSLTGGLQNPFAIFLIAPAIVSATSLRQNQILLLGGLSIVAICFLAAYHEPLPWDPQAPLRLPTLFIVGVNVAILCTLAFTTIYVFRVAQEARKLADALSATELVLQREQHIGALDGMAAAAAHELGTPLATIALVSKEMEHALPKDSPLLEDATLLRSQAQRCREILQRFASLSSEGEAIVEEQELHALVEEVVAPLRELRTPIIINVEGDPQNPAHFKRSAGLHYGLGNLIDNAVDFSRTKVVIDLAWDDETVALSIRDDGPGFPPGLLSKLGEPFVTARSAKRRAKRPGMGLGLFISKTLLARSGAEVRFENHLGEKGRVAGALVSIVWRRSDLSGNA